MKTSSQQVRQIKVAALQCALSSDRDQNLKKVLGLVKKSAEAGAHIILPPELFETPYFCREERDEFFSWSRTLESSPAVQAMQSLAKECRVVIPVSFFEKSGPAYFNSVAMIDATGEVLGVYRKSHIPDGPGYEEKFYFRPGDTGFKVWKTRHGQVGVGICWDQWFPECARAMTLLGAEILLYPTAIGSEPEAPELDTKDLWQRAMIGHAVCNVIPVVAANRIGTEGGQTYYGHSFIADHRGEKIKEMGRADEGIIAAEIDLNLVETNRASFGFFRDRRPDLYQALTR